MRTKQRAGFTLVELMVAMALTLFVMVILTQAFVTSLETFAAMKGIGDMQIMTRTARNVMLNDLVQDHLEAKRRLSDLDANGLPLILGTNQKIQAGFFAVRHGSQPVLASSGTVTPATPYVNEGIDSNGVASYRANDQMLYMTVKRKGNRQENMFATTMLDPPAGANISLFFNPTINTAYNMPPAVLSYSTLTQPYQVGSNLPSATYASQWAEVLYYLVPTGTTEEPTNPAGIGTRLFSLYRAQFVMTPDGGTLTTGVSSVFKTPTYTVANLGLLATSTFSGMSCNPVPPAAPTNLAFFSPADAANGNRMVPALNGFNAAGDSRLLANGNNLLPNVISFHIQVMPTDWNAIANYVPGNFVGYGGGTFYCLKNNTALTPPSDAATWLPWSATPFANVPTYTGVAGAPYGIYDTTQLTPTSGYPTSGLKAIQITIRVWDNASRQSRQMTIVQDL